MKEQDCIRPNSKKLYKFLDDFDKFHFENHGYDNTSLNNSNRTVRLQKEQLNSSNYYGEIWLSTTIGQPFLFWNMNNELDISGILNYDYESQLGTFCHHTISGELCIENVHSYMIFFNMQISNGNYKHMPFFSKYVPELEEVQDIYVPMIIQDKDNTFSLQLYHNTTMISEYRNVYPELYFEYHETTAYKNRLAYFRFSASYGKNAYHNYIYDINNNKVINMDDSIETPSFYINYTVCANVFNKVYSDIINDFEARLLKGKTISIIFHLDNSKTAAIVAEFVKTADAYEILENAFDDDDTKNIKVTYENRPEDVRFLYYCFSLNEDLLGGAIFEKSISDYIIGTKNYVKEYKVVLTYSKNEIEYYKMMVKEIFKRCNEEISINRLPMKIYENYIEGFRMLKIIHDYCYSYDNIWGSSLRKNKLPFQHFIMKDKSKIFEKEKVQYDEIYRLLVKRDKIPARWKNEYNLYKALLKKYPDAIYQYHCSWLGKQSLDIFIPSENLAFEYQGEQHYRPIDFFGGEKEFIHRVKLDEKKRRLCIENGVKLIEWKYDEPISKKTLEVQLELLEK